MFSHIETIKKNLSAADKKQLEKIYEPTVVQELDYYVFARTCVTKEGEIRHYSEIDRPNPYDAGQRVYYASKDCGLSWKMHIVEDDNVMGYAVKSPYSERYLALYNKDGAVYVKYTEEGFDSTNVVHKRVLEENIRYQRQLIPLKSRKRWLCMAQYGFEDLSNTAVVLYSDDDGDSWKSVYMPKAPRYEAKPPHKGPRWYDSSEPTVVELKDGKLMMLFRTSQDYHYISYSEDAGETWSIPEASNFHSTLTMPLLYRLSDGRMMFFWCNTQPLPELDHTKQQPPLTTAEIEGALEDVFTNRDANHAAISEDDGNTWIGFREMFLNPIRNNCDFRTVGGSQQLNDKSVHHFDALELPYNKMMVLFGQHRCCSRIIIFDINWLYEKCRSEDFLKGLCNLSTHVYLKSVSGNRMFKPGHCAWNRVSGAVMMPDPDNIREEALLIRTNRDDRLFSNIEGAVWNFPAAHAGSVKIKMRLVGEGLRISLIDRWMNAMDTTISEDAHITFIADRTLASERVWSEIEVRWTKEKAEVFSDGKSVLELPVTKDSPNGLSYLHLQSLEGDFGGGYIKELTQVTL